MELFDNIDETEINNTNICKLNKTSFETLIEILSTAFKNGNLFIKDSKICQVYISGILSFDLSTLLQSSTFSLHINKIENRIKYFKNIKDICDENDVVEFITTSDKYIVRCKNSHIYLPKIDNSNEEVNLYPDECLDKTYFLGNPVIFQTTDKKLKTKNKNDPTYIKTFIKNSEKKESILLVYEDELIGVMTEDGKIIFNEKDYNVNTSDCINLKSYTFLGIDANNYTIQLIKDNSEEYHTVTKMTSDKFLDNLGNHINLILYEKLIPNYEMLF